MRKKIIIIIFILSFFYILWPFFNIYRFYIAVKRTDIEFLTNNIDWISLRAGFKNDLEIIIDQKIGKKKSIEKQILKSLLGNNLIEIILEEIVSPENIVLLLNDPNKYKDMLKEEMNNPNKNIKKKQNIKKEKFKLEGPNIKRIREKVNYVFFINLNTFRIDFDHDGYPIKIDLKFSPFKWRVHKIYLPVNLLVSKI
tara:strand:- start:278 stop:868 length:591 start_codon:yes stop_codon:yes gene_type:complete